MAKFKLNVTDFKFTGNNVKLQSDIKKAIITKFDDSLLRERIQGLIDELSQFFYLKFVQSDTFVSMMTGDLKGEFGFTDAYLNNIDDICIEITRVYLDYKVSRTKDFLTVIIGINDKEKIDYSDIGVFTTEKGEQIHWLYWLLTQGTTPVVPDYNVLLKSGAGRSHMAVMYKRDGDAYSVNPEHAGVVGDNWITRILDQNKDEFISILKKAFSGT